MFDDPKSKRVWRQYRLRAELMLGGVAGDVRRQILEDLDVHMRDAIAASDSTDEFEQVTETLTRLGDPKEFIAPLLSDAVLQDRPHGAGLGAVLRLIADYAAQGGVYLRRAVSIVFFGAGGALMMVLAVASILRPGLAGVYVLGPNEIQIRMFGFGESEGAPVFAPWLEIIIGLIGVGFMFVSWRLLRRTVAETLARRQ